MVIAWRPGSSCMQLLEPIKHDTHHVDRVRLDQERPDWTQLRVLQLLMCDDTAAIAEVSGGKSTEANSAADPLSKAGCPPYLRALRKRRPTTTNQVLVPT